MIKDRSYFRDYLCKYLTEEDDPRKDDDAFIDARAELAAATMEEDTFYRFQVGEQQRIPRIPMDDSIKNKSLSLLKRQGFLYSISR